MKYSVTTVARSSLGVLIAMGVTAAVLFFAGMYVLTDGGILTRNVAQPGRTGVPRFAADAIGDQLKKIERPQLIAAYGVLILASVGIAAIMGCFIRTYRFRFLAGQKAVERQALWLFIPAWWLAGLALMVVVMALDRASAAALATRFAGPAAASKTVTFLLVPIWLVLSGAIVAVILLVAWFVLRDRMRWSLHIPGGRKRIPFAQVAQMEIRATGEGAVVLAMHLTGQRTWIISRGRPRRLARVGKTLGRLVGLERRDLMTWK